MGLFDWGKRKRDKSGADMEPGAQKPDPDAMIRVVEQPFAQAPLTEGRILNDDSVYAVFNIFSDILLGSGSQFVGKDAEKVKEWTDKLPMTPGWATMLDAMAASWFQRYSAVEMVWNTSEGWVPEEFRVLPNKMTSLHLDDRQRVIEVNVTTSGGLQTLPLQNVVVHRYRPTFEHALGQCVYDRLKEVIDYKRRCDDAIIRLVERFAGPAVVGYYPPGTSKEKQKEFFEAIKRLQRAAFGILPGPKGEKGNEIEMLEAQNSGTMDFALAVLEMYERRIARAVLGSVLAVFESQYGTRAQSETHLKILQKVVAGYQEDVENPVNAQLVKPYLAYNVPNGAKLDVKWKLNAPDFSDLQKTGQWVESLCSIGVLDPENEEDNNLIRTLFDLDLRDYKKYPETPPDEREKEGLPPGGKSAWQKLLGKAGGKAGEQES